MLNGLGFVVVAGIVAMLLPGVALAAHSIHSVVVHVLQEFGSNQQVA